MPPGLVDGTAIQGIVPHGTLPVVTATTPGCVPATGTPSGKFLRDDASWQNASGGPADVSVCWPIGSVFLSVLSTNPNTLLGFGTWSQIAPGQMLVGFKTGDSDFGTLEGTGGAKTVSHSAHTGTAIADHTVTQPANHSNHVVTQPANHSNHVVTQPASHTVVSTKQGSSSGNVVTTGTHSGTAVDAHSAHTGTAVDAHSAHTGTAVSAHNVTQPSAHSDHNILNPFFVIYAWKRTA
jgi:hypothetical protein